MTTRKDKTVAVSINKVIVAGNIVRDPEFKATAKSCVVKFTIAANEKYKDGDQWKTKAEYVPIVAFGKTAELVEKYLGKGSAVLVEGKFSTSSWDGQDGKKHYRSEIIASNVQFLSSKKQDGRADAQEPDQNDQQPTGGSDEVPF